MKKFFTLFAIFAVLMLVVSCGGSSKNDDKTDTGDTVNDEDTVDTDAADSEPAGDNEPGGDDATHDDTDSDNPDTASEQDDDADTVSEQNDDDVDTVSEQTGAEKCAEAGGTWSEEGKKCSKEVKCKEKPANSVWNGESSYTQVYVDGKWFSELATQYSAEESGECSFKCAGNYFWNGTSCVSPCDPDPCADVELSDGICTVKSETEFECGCLKEHVFDPATKKCVIPMCGSTGVTPCYDPDSELYWSSKIPSAASYGKNWNEAWQHCEDLVEGGFDDWTLPTIDELRTLVQNCESIETGNSCPVSEVEDCLTDECRTGDCFPLECPEDKSGIYSKLGDNDRLWASSKVSGADYEGVESAWIMLFDHAQIMDNLVVSTGQHVRCVRKEDPCQPENPCAGKANSTGKCIRKGAETFACGCAENYAWNGSGCVLSCSTNPCGTVENSDGTCTITGETTYECGCKTNYTWTASQCKADTRKADCTGLPANAKWNTSSKITQTWNGRTWRPVTNGVYSSTPCTDACCFTCKNNYEWDSTASACKPKTQTVSCSEKPAHSVWNSISEVNQTWNGSDWEPSNVSVYSRVSSPRVCRYKCDSGYIWTGSTCKSVSAKWLSIGNICTGQDKCYDGVGTEIYCSTSGLVDDFYGEDAHYASEGKCTPKNFIVDSSYLFQKTVIDVNTGLEWQQNPTNTTYSWKNAVSYCENLTYAGESDWRLPTPMEFHTIADSGRYAPAFDTTYFPNITDSESSRFWTSQERKADTSKAYYAEYYTSYSDIESKTTFYSVMCVRGSTLPAASFATQTISGKSVVSDSATGLMWQTNWGTNKKWVDALKYCEDLTYAGYSDWRLPNRNELLSLLNYNKSGAPYSDFPDMPKSFFWSSTTYAGSADRAWRSDFSYGDMLKPDKTLKHNVRCVRN